ncbi:hypothetical protein J2X54_002479 [Duganella sp. 3397]|uniref:hypothetical protein n=1 Tax=Duganella sp. 3397 TaxID=2817732 RepID=UPI00285D4744|nr:hypothetical protein [Duganella sp. 3397]MDR7050024.1 hypothetical protein [Duganella sp. 3397]
MTTNKDEIAFENAIKSLEATAASMGAHLETDSTARRSYANQINAVSNSLRADVHAGKLTWLQAADQACRTRNLLMEIIRAAIATSSGKSNVDVGPAAPACVTVGAFVGGAVAAFGAGNIW